MSCMCNNLKLPIMNKYELIRCIKMYMNNGEEYTIKVGDLVGIQFVKDDKRILVRRGRIKDIVIYNRRTLTTSNDNLSHIILDCSEQFTIKILEIKLTDIIKIGGIDDEFEDYSDRIKQLDPNFIVDEYTGCKIPVRQNGMYTEEEMVKKITKPDKEDVVKMNPETGVFDDLYDMNQNRPYIDELRQKDDDISDKKEDESETSDSSVSTESSPKKISKKGIPLMR